MHGQLGPTTGFLQKPFTLQNLAKKVREVLRSKSAQTNPAPTAPDKTPALKSVAKSAAN
jgi:DNA-binding response OmpR family regulator